MRSCIKRSSNSSMARRAYSDLLMPKRFAVASMLAARPLGMRREKEVRSSMGAPECVRRTTYCITKKWKFKWYILYDISCVGIRPCKGVRVKSSSRVRGSAICGFSWRLAIYV